MSKDEDDFEEEFDFDIDNEEKIETPADYLKFGNCWACWQTALQQKIPKDLKDTFDIGWKILGPDPLFHSRRYCQKWNFAFDPNDFLRIAIYQYLNDEEEDGYAMWQQCSWLPEVTYLTNNQIQSLLDEVGFDHLEKYCKFRFKRALAHSKALKRKDNQKEIITSKRFMVFVCKHLASPEGSCEGYYDENGNPNPPIFYLVMVMDWDTGNLCYAKQYERPLTDTSFYQDLLKELRDFGFNLEEALLIDDTRNASIELVKPVFDSGISYLFEISLNISDLKNILNNPALSQEEREIKYEEIVLVENSNKILSTQKSVIDPSDLKEATYLYRAYYPDDKKDPAFSELMKLVEGKNKNGNHFSAKTNKYEDLIVKEGGKWKIDYSSLCKKIAPYSYFLRTNYFQDPEQCFKIYNLFFEVQKHFGRYRLNRENWMGNKFFNEEALFFLHVLNQSIRVAHKLAIYRNDNLIQDPLDVYDSSVMCKLGQVYAIHKPNQDEWVRTRRTDEDDRYALKLLGIKKTFPYKVPDPRKEWNDSF